MSKKIIAFLTGTAVVLAVAIGWQAFGASNAEEDKDRQAPAVSTEMPPTDPSTEPSTDPGASSSTAAAPEEDTTEQESDDDDARDWYTAEHTGKPGENKG